MSFAQIEAELEYLSADELRRLALKSWRAFVLKEGTFTSCEECSEDDPRLLAALDEALAQADASPASGVQVNEVLGRVREWTTR